MVCPPHSFSLMSQFVFPNNSTPCPIGTFAEVNATTACTQCAKGQVTIASGTTTRSACVTTLELIFPPSISGFIWPAASSRYVTWKTAALDQPDFLARQVKLELLSPAGVAVFTVQSPNDGSELIELPKISAALPGDKYSVQLTLLPADQNPVAIVRSSKFSIHSTTAQTPDPVGVNLALNYDQPIPTYGTVPYMTLRDTVI